MSRYDLDGRLLPEVDPPPPLLYPDHCPGLVKQPFRVGGRHVVPVATMRYRPQHDHVRQARDDLSSTFRTWLWISPVVLRWRREPSLEVARDFEHDRVIVQLSARGWLDLDVPPGTSPWVITLPTDRDLFSGPSI